MDVVKHLNFTNFFGSYHYLCNTEICYLLNFSIFDVRLQKLSEYHFLLALFPYSPDEVSEKVPCIGD